MNSFDAAVYAGLALAVVTGFKAGLLRSAVTILAYLIATPIAVWIMSLVAPEIDGKQPAQTSLLFFGIFLVGGMVLGKSMRMALDETIGPEAGIGERLAGAALGAIRVGLVAITLVLTFDRLVPLYYNRADRERGYIESVDRYGQLRRFPVMTVSVAAVTKTARVRNHNELAVLAAELKKQAKAVPETSYVRDGEVVLPASHAAAPVIPSSPKPLE